MQRQVLKDESDLFSEYLSTNIILATNKWIQIVDRSVLDQAIYNIQKNYLDSSSC